MDELNEQIRKAVKEGDFIEANRLADILAEQGLSFEEVSDVFQQAAGISEIEFESIIEIMY